jgi:IS5 family transposase
VKPLEDKQRVNKKRRKETQGGDRMLVDRYDPEDVFARVPRIAERVDLVLKELDRLLDDDELYRASCEPTSASAIATRGSHGRHSTPVEVILRLLICKHLYQWSYQQTRDEVDRDLVLRLVLWVLPGVLGRCA